MHVQEVMNPRVVSTTPLTTVAGAFAAMSAHKVSGMPVINSHREVLGFVSELDLLKPSGRLVAEVMTSPAIVAFPYETLDEVASRMLDSGVTRLPVLDLDDLLVGVVTAHDLLRSFADDGSLDQGLRSPVPSRRWDRPEAAGREPSSGRARPG